MRKYIGVTYVFFSYVFFYIVSYLLLHALVLPHMYRWEGLLFLLRYANLVKEIAKKEVLMDDRIVVGNAKKIEMGRGWFVGHFMPPGPLSTQYLEVKWAETQRGEERALWSTKNEVTTLTILIRGKMRIFFPGGKEVLLERKGDFVLWPPDMPHRWKSEEKSLTITVRWPSIPE